MEITLEQAEQLREKAGVSYAAAKQALEYSQGNLLDALIYLEEQGNIPRAEGAYYSTKNESVSGIEGAIPVGLVGVPSQQDAPPGGFWRRVRGWLLDNEFEIWRREQPITAVPVLILLLMMLMWVVVLPLLAVSLFFGFRYRFSGPDLSREGLNTVMDSMADTASQLGRHVMDELRRQHEKRGKD